MALKLVFFCAVVHILNVESFWIPPGPGPYGPGGPYGFGGPFGPGGPYGAGGPFGPGGPYGFFGKAALSQKFDSLQSRGLMGPGAFGPGAVSPYATMYQQFLTNKFSSLMLAKGVKKQYNAAVMAMNNSLTLAKNELELELEDLKSAVESVEANSNSASCSSEFQTSYDQIVAKIDELNINVETGELGTNIKANIGALHAQIGSKGSSLWMCKGSSMLTPPEDVELCASQQQEAQNTQAQDLKESVTNDTADLQDEVTALIDDVTTEVIKLIADAKDNFDECVSQSSV